MEKEKNVSIIKAPSKSLPITGVPIAGIRKYAEFPSRVNAERDLLNFINSCMNAEKIYGCVIKAWWGEGKTDAYENFIKPELEKRKLLVYDTIATTVARIFEDRHAKGTSDPVVWRAFLSALFESIWEERKSQSDHIKFFRRSEEESDFEYILRVIDELKKRCSKVFFFIDEVEQLEPRPLRDDILLGIRGLFDQKEEFLRGNLHLIMACTPDAFNRLVGSSTQMGGLIERLTIVELPRPLDDEAVKFVYGLINYIYEGKLPASHPFVNSGPAYSIMHAGHRSPRSMIKALQQVIEYAKSLANEPGYIHRIDGWVVVEALKNYNLPIFGTQVFALDGDTLDRVIRLMNVRGQPEKTKRIERLITLLVGEPIPHLVEELSSRLNVREKELKEAIGIANNRVNEVALLNGLLILQVKEIKTPEEDIPEEVKPYVIKFLLYTVRSNFITKQFLPASPRALMSMHQDLNITAAQRIFHRFASYLDINDYYMISPEFVQRIFPNPDFLELDFIVDKNKRLELWKEAYERVNEIGILSQAEDSLVNLLKSVRVLVE